MKTINHQLVRNVMEVSRFHKKHQVNDKCLKKKLSLSWQQVKAIIRKCLTCYLYNQTQRTEGISIKGTQRNEIHKMYLYHFTNMKN